MRAEAGRGPLVGAHMSAAGGLPKAVDRAAAAGCRALQVFTKSSNQWAGKPIGPAEAAAFHDAARAAALEPLVAHSAYLINLGGRDPLVTARSLAALVDEIRRCDALGIAYLVLHPGSHGGDGEEAGIERIARGLDAALAETDGSKATVLLETAAGQGASVGHTFQQLAAVLAAVADRRRLALCFDTCHVHAAGYDLVSRDGFRRTLDELERSCGLDLVKVVHANDSKGPRGCRVDRHERIGHGALGEAAFENLMTERAFEGVPKILETPKDDEGLWDREGLAALRRLSRARRGARRQPRRGKAEE